MSSSHYTFNRPHHENYENLIYFNSDLDMISFFGRQEDEKRLWDTSKALAGVVGVGAIATLADLMIGQGIPKTLSYGGGAALVGKSVGPGLREIMKQQSTFPRYEGKTMIGIHVLFNGRGVGHSSVDSNVMWTYEIMNVSKYLPELMAELKNKYSHCFGKPSLLEADFHPNNPHVPFMLYEDTKHTWPDFEAD